MPNVMLDIETLGNGSNAVILSIGAVAFDETGVKENSFYRVVDAKTCTDVGMVMDVSTVMWWMKQSDAARKAFEHEPSPLRAVLGVFSVWMNDLGTDVCVWGNGATFDNVILSNAYKACDMNRPWSYRNDRCYRTLKAMYPWIKAQQTTGVAHNALDDARYQALHAVKILTALKGATYG